MVCSSDAFQSNPHDEPIQMQPRTLSEMACIPLNHRLAPTWPQEMLTTNLRDEGGQVGPVLATCSGKLEPVRGFSLPTVLHPLV